jgi:hypothetical protein
VQFSFGFSEGTPPEVIQGFNAAGELWSSFLSDDVTVNLAVQYESLSNPRLLGSFSPARISYTYQDTLRALRDDASSPNDAIAFSSLPKSSEFEGLPETSVDFDVLINATSNNPNGAGSFVPYVDNNGSCNNRSVRMTAANAKALGLPLTGTSTCGSTASSGNVPIRDGTLTINSDFNWDFDISDGIDPLAYDFVGVAAKGIGTTLGFISGVDVLDDNSPSQADLMELNGFRGFSDDVLSFVSLPDLYRFSDQSAALGVIDWTTGGINDNGETRDKYFSIDGGQTAIAQFSTGVNRGDGRTASSWKADELGGAYLGIAEPTPNAGQVLQFTNNDQIFFDVIGWNLANPFSDPPSRAIRTDDGSNGDGSPDPSDPNDPKSIPEPSSVVAFVPVVWVGVAWLAKKRRR